MNRVNRGNDYMDLDVFISTDFLLLDNMIYWRRFHPLTRFRNRCDTRWFYKSTTFDARVVFFQLIHSQLLLDMKSECDSEFIFIAIHRARVAQKMWLLIMCLLSGEVAKNVKHIHVRIE